MNLNLPSAAYQNRPRDSRLRCGKNFPHTALKAHHMTAQGNALGTYSPKQPSPEATVLIGKLKVWIFEEAVHQDDKFAHARGKSD